MAATVLGSSFLNQTTCSLFTFTPYLDILGIPVRFYDTAGLRKSKNLIEKLGIERTKKIAEESDVNLVFIEKASEISDFKDIRNPIFIKSKHDLVKKHIKNKEILHISSKTNYGIKELLKKIHLKLNSKLIEDPSISRERHKETLKNTNFHMTKSLEDKNIDIFAEDIRLASAEITKITGKIDIEDILEIIFNDFCIGK